MSETFLFQAIWFSQTVLIQIIQFSISIVFVYTLLNVKTILFRTIQFCMSTQFKCQTVLFQAIRLSISTQFSSIWPIDRALSDVITPGQSGPGSDGNEVILRISQSSSISVTSISDCLVSYPGHTLGGSYPTADVLSLYSTASGDLAIQQWANY